MTYLLDASVLIALMDEAHVFHLMAENWFDQHVDEWATCPITENAVIRILGQPAYRNSPGGPGNVVKLLRDFLAHPRHVFWPDDASLLANASFDATALRGSAQVTDAYLIVLARQHRGQLVTLDSRIVSNPAYRADHTLVLR